MTQLTLLCKSALGGLLGAYFLANPIVGGENAVLPNTQLLETVRPVSTFGNYPTSTKAYAELLLSDRMVVTGETIQLVVRAPKNTALSSLFVEFVADGRLSVAPADNNFNITNSSRSSGIFVGVEQEMLANEAVLLLTYSAAKNGLLSDLITLARNGKNEAFTATDNQRLPIALIWDPIKQTASKGISVFKSKIASELTVGLELSSPGDYLLSVKDLTGRGFAERRITGTAAGWKSQRIDIKNWAAGTYIIQLEGPAGRFSERIVLP